MAKKEDETLLDKSHIRWACQKIITAAGKGVYGKFEISMEDGRVTNFKECINHKPPKPH